MKLVTNHNITDPRRNLALEEYLLRHVESEDPLLLFYINEPSVIIGRNQVTMNEIDQDFINDQGIHVVRRLSGGGAVYHDLGNLNFSFVTDDDRDIHNFSKFINPVVDTLKRLGVPAELHPPSDVFVDQKKVSGNAQFSSRGRLFSHGTILFKTDLSEMLKALNPRQIKIETKAVQSVRNFVTNVSDWLPDGFTIDQLKQEILKQIFDDSGVDHYELTEVDWMRIDELAERRYDNWEWVYGRSPKFNIQKQETIGRVTYDVRLQVERGYIEDLSIYGNFEAREELDEFVARFKNKRYDAADMGEWLDSDDIEPYLGQLTLEQFLAILF